jgi:hypothetical protein
MTYTTFGLLWYLTGVATIIFNTIVFYGRVTVDDIVKALVLGFLGFFTLVVSVFAWTMFFLDKHSDKVIYERKKKE